MKLIKIILFVFTTSCTTIFGEGEAPIGLDRNTKLDSILNDAYKSTKVPGICIGLWVPYENSYTKCIGQARLRSNDSMDFKNHIRMGSITKTFTATLLMILAEKGLLSLDDPISKYGFENSPKPAVTLRQLVSMQSGLANFSFDANFQTELFTQPEKKWDIHGLIDLAFQKTLKNCPESPSYCFEPGTRFAYSNTNFAILAVILEKASGLSYSNLLKRYISNPLKMRHTYSPTDSKLPQPFSHGYTLQGSENNIARDATLSNPGWGLGSGHLISTMNDLKIWAKALGSGSLLNSRSAKNMFEFFNVPPNSKDQYYALGVGFKKGWWGHAGSIPGYNTQILYHPVKKATIVISVNHDEIRLDGKMISPAQWIADKMIVAVDSKPNS